MKTPLFKNAARRGFTLIEMLAVIAAIVVLVALCLPAMMPAKARVKRINCVNCLKQIGLAFKLWAGDYNDKFPMQVSVTNGGTMELVASRAVYPHFQVMSNELSTPRLLVCPEDTTRKSARVFDQNLSDGNVSYFIGVDADPNRPAMFLVGDNNLGVGGVPAKPGLLALWTNSPVGWVKLRHNYGGNICLADGSVHQVSDTELRQLLQQTGVATNRLAMP